jgi:hypothetical protein
VGVESWLETRSCAASGFDPSVVGIASQPFWLHWTDEGGLPSAEPRWPNKYIEYQVISLHGRRGANFVPSSQNRGHEAFWIESVKLRTQR